jgi:hypothetical protein
MSVSLRAYARMRGCSLTAVQKAIASKRITTLPDGTIDAERANQDWAKNTFAGQTDSQGRMLHRRIGFRRYMSRLPRREIRLPRTCGRGP